jgi:hypothetical protein
MQVQAAIIFVGESFFKSLRTKLLRKMGSRRSELSSKGRGIWSKAEIHEEWGLSGFRDAHEYRERKLKLLKARYVKKVLCSQKKHQFITCSLGAYQSTCSPSENMSLLLFVLDAFAIKSRTCPTRFIKRGVVYCDV